MTARLESELRELLAAKVSAPPQLKDQTAAVVGRAHRMRRRRWSGAAAAIATAVAVTVIATNGLTGVHRSQYPAQTPAPARPTVTEVVVDGVLIEADGSRTLLDDSEISEVVRIPAGLLYLLHAAGERSGRNVDDELPQARLRRPDGTTVDLGEVFNPRFSRDGRRVVYTTGRQSVVAAAVTANRLAVAGSWPGGAGTTALGWYGDRLLLGELGQVANGGSSSDGRYAVWDPGDAAPPRWHAAGGVELLGAAEDQRRYLGVRAKPRSDVQCLVELDPSRRFRLIRENCDLGLTGNSNLLLSPHGQYLAVQSDTAVRVLDIATAFDRPRWRDGCPSGGPMRGSPGWVSADTLLAGLVCRMLPSGKVKTHNLPAAPPDATVMYVIRIGV